MNATDLCVVPRRDAVDVQLVVIFFCLAGKDREVGHGPLADPVVVVRVER